MRALLYSNMTGWIGSVGLLALRLVIGAAFLVHGLPKIQSPLTWMPPAEALPGALQVLTAIAEFGGGLALTLGLLTRLGALGISIVMAVDVTVMHLWRGHPFIALPAGSGPSYELALIFLACAILFLLMGPGRFSLDALCFGRPAAACKEQHTSCFCAGQQERISANDAG